MSIFKKATKSNQDMMVNNIKYGLPFTGPGSKYKDVDYTLTQIDVDSYQLEVGNTFGSYYMPSVNGSLTVSATGINMVNSARIIDAQTAKDVISGVSLPHLGLPRMTSQEKNRLEELKKELQVWKKQEKINMFKTLPASIRQEIVDDAILNELITNINSIKDQNFPDYKEIQTLENKSSVTISAAGGMIYSGLSHISVGNPYASINHPNQTINSKYSYILQQFSKEELMNAHLEASLEDELGN